MQDIKEPALTEAAAEIVPPQEVSSESTASSSKDRVVEDSVEKQDGDSTPASGTTASSNTTVTDAERKTTTGVRKPLNIPDSVHVTIDAENLLEYVGPPMYQKDRMYTKTSPVGVSTGLGYLGNGSGSVMPIEVTVSAKICMQDCKDQN